MDGKLLSPNLNTPQVMPQWLEYGISKYLNQNFEELPQWFQKHESILNYAILQMT
jgi:hypothetical protein